jgi:hypothetical protein
MFLTLMTTALMVAAWGRSGCVSESAARAAAPETSKMGQRPQNFGIDPDWTPNGEKFTINGVPITKEQAKRLLTVPTLEDDSGKLRLTVIGSKDERRRVLEDLGREPLNRFGPSFVVQAYDPADWAVANYGFVTTGKPTIYVQEPSGKVLHRQDDYADGAVGLCKALEAIRKPDPNYDRTKDPDLRIGPARTKWLLIGAAVLVVLLLMKRNSNGGK